MKINPYNTAILLILLSISCKQEVKVEEDNNTEHTAEILIENVKNDDVEIIEIDDCEYIVLKSTPSDNARIGYGFMAHKGNCKNPIHYHNRKISTLDTIE
jgi:hypothetical protein